MLKKERELSGSLSKTKKLSKKRGGGLAVRHRTNVVHRPYAVVCHVDCRRNVTNCDGGIINGLLLYSYTVIYRKRKQDGAPED